MLPTVAVLTTRVRTWSEYLASRRDHWHNYHAELRRYRREYRTECADRRRPRQPADKAVSVNAAAWVLAVTLAVSVFLFILVKHGLEEEKDRTRYWRVRAVRAESRIEQGRLEREGDRSAQEKAVQEFRVSIERYEQEASR